jgi:hypothetical protein
MKQLLYFIALIFSANIVSAQTVPSSCTASANIMQQYADDADYMTLQRIISLNDTHKDSITIPQAWADTAMRAMLAVYNATTLPARDSVVTIYKIHEYASFTMHMIFLTADSNETYMKQMKKNIFPTGDAAFDNLGNKYTIQSSQYLNFGTTPGNHDLTLQLDSAYNTPILKDEYNILSGLQIAKGTLNVFGDSNHINYTVTPTYVELQYTHGWENCMDMNGCDKRHTWTFRVSYNCDVTYIGSSGDPLFPPVNGIQDVSSNGFSVYPNPTANTLHIKGIDGKMQYRILDILGKIKATGNTQNINVSHLPAGQYFLQVQTSDNIFSARFTRQ